MMTEARDAACARRTAPWVALTLAVVMLVVPVSAPLCASALGVCAMPEAVPPPIDAHCPMAEAMGHGGMEQGEAAGMECCVSDAAPQGPTPAVPNAEQQRAGASLLALAPAAAVPDLAALPAAPAPPPPAADLAASAVPLYTLLSSLLS